MMRGRWRTVCKDVFLVVVGVLIGVCLSQFLKTVQCSSGDSLPFIKIKSKLSSNLNINASSIEHQQQGQDQYQHDLRLKQEEMKTRLNLDKTQFDKTQPRPKYLKEELKIREPLYVGVVTAVSFLNSRAMDINGTWAHKLSKVDYFAAEGQGPHPLSVVSLEGVDDTYPPQKKVYRMLRYMHDNYIDKFNWFLRADDDAYIRVPELLSFLSILDPNVPLYIGSPGLGKPEDLERIKLLPHERYCMGGPGVIFSRALLIQLAPHLDDCLENVVVSYNEDVEVGRCISRKLGIQCTWAYEARKLFFMDYSKGRMFESDKVYADRAFTTALTAHPFKTTDLLYRVHQFFLEISIKNNEKIGFQLKKELETVKKKTKRAKPFP